MIGSDMAAMLENTDTFMEVKDMEYAVIAKNDIKIFTSYGKVVARKRFKAHIDASDIARGAYPHNM